MVPINSDLADIVRVEHFPSILFVWAFGPRNLMKNWHHAKGGSGKVVGTVEKSRL